MSNWRECYMACWHIWLSVYKHSCECHHQLKHNATVTHSQRNMQIRKSGKEEGGGVWRSTVNAKNSVCPPKHCNSSTSPKGKVIISSASPKPLDQCSMSPLNFGKRAYTNESRKTSSDLDSAAKFGRNRFAKPECCFQCSYLLRGWPIRLSPSHSHLAWTELRVVS